MLHGVYGIGAIRQGSRFLEPVHERRMVLITLNGYVGGDLVLLAERYIAFTEIAVIRKEVGNGSEFLSIVLPFLGSQVGAVSARS